MGLSRSKKLLITLKIATMVAIVGYLVSDALDNNAFAQLQNQPKNWWLLGAAGMVCASAVLLTMVRWYFLVRALELPFTIKDALRLGFLGYLFNLAPMGIVGGDGLKAWMLARGHPGRRAEAVATVVVDRIIGLYLLFVVASVAILLTRFWDSPHADIVRMCKATLALTVIGGVGIAVVMLPDLSRGRTTRMLARLPYVGPTLEQLAQAVKMYRSKQHILLAAALMSVGVHSLFTVGIFLICSALYQTVPSFGMHFVLSPVSAVAGVIPLNIGPFEWALNYLYAKVPMPAGMVVAASQGFVVALGYRIITVLIALIGICYYLSSRKELAEVLHEAEEQDEAEEQEEAEEQDEAEEQEGTPAERPSMSVDPDEEAFGVSAEQSS